MATGVQGAAWRCAALGLLIGWVAACSDDGGPTATTSGGANGGGGTASLPEPNEHRPEAETCTGEPPAGNAIPDRGGECTTDADCVDGVNGRCNWPYGGGNRCIYDECFEDADCGGVSVCACRVGNEFGVNKCYAGNFVVDADCGAGCWCSPSGIVGPTCMEGISPGSVGFFCHTAADECSDDDDCAAEVETCLFEVDSQRWRCHELLCTG